jgi:hypothetical protein
MYDEKFNTIKFKFPSRERQAHQFRRAPHGFDDAVCEQGWHLLYCLQFISKQKSASEAG